MANGNGLSVPNRGKNELTCATISPMSAEARPENCPLYPDRESTYYRVKSVDYIVKNVGVEPKIVVPENAECMAKFLPDWSPNMSLEGSCNRCHTRVVVTPTTDPWAKSS